VIDLTRSSSRLYANRIGVTVDNNSDLKHLRPDNTAGYKSIRSNSFNGTPTLPETCSEHSFYNVCGGLVLCPVVLHREQQRVHVQLVSRSTTTLLLLPY